MATGLLRLIADVVLYGIILLHIVLFIQYFDALVSRRVRLLYLVIVYAIILYCTYSLYGVLETIASETRRSYSSLEWYDVEFLETSISTTMCFLGVMSLFTVFIPLILIARLEIDRRINPWKFKRSYSELSESFLGLATLYYFYENHRVSTIVLYSTSMLVAVSWVFLGFMGLLPNSLCRSVRTTGLSIESCRGVAGISYGDPIHLFLMTLSIIEMVVFTKATVYVLSRVHGCSR